MTEIERKTAICYVRKSAERDGLTKQLAQYKQGVEAAMELEGWKTEWYEDTVPFQKQLIGNANLLKLTLRLSEPDVAALIVPNLTALYPSASNLDTYWKLLTEFLATNSVKMVIAEKWNWRKLDFSTIHDRAMIAFELFYLSEEQKDAEISRYIS